MTVAFFYWSRERLSTLFCAPFLRPRSNYKDRSAGPVHSSSWLCVAAGRPNALPTADVSQPRPDAPIGDQERPSAAGTCDGTTVAERDIHDGTVILKVTDLF